MDEQKREELRQGLIKKTNAVNQIVRNSKKVISDSETQEQLFKDVKEKFSMDVTKHDEIIEDITSETIEASTFIAELENSSIEKEKRNRRIKEKFI